MHRPQALKFGSDFPTACTGLTTGLLQPCPPCPCLFCPFFLLLLDVWMLQCATSRSTPCLCQACCPLHKAPSWARRGRGHCRTAARRGARPAPCQLRAANLHPVGQGIGAAPETRAARTQAEQQPSPSSLQGEEAEQHQKPFAVTHPQLPPAPVGSSHLAGHSSRASSRLPCMPHTMPGADGSLQPSAPASSRCSERAAPGTSRPHRDPRGSPTPAASPLRSPGGRDKGQRAALKPPGAARPARRPLPPAPSRHSPDSASELVARLRAAGGRSVRRGQRGARAGPSRRTASHAIFAGRPEAGRCRAELPPHGGGRGRHFLTAPSRLSARGGQRGCLGISAVCRWREGGREAPGMCGKAPVAAASLGK